MIILFVSTCSRADTAERTSQDAALDEDSFVRVSVYRLSVDPANKQPVVALADSAEQRVFPIWIGLSEAQAIHMELQGSESFRPLTHDLLAGIIAKVNGTVSRVVITHIKDNVFYATLVIKKDKTLVEVDARPSDSLVMALKFDAPIYVERSLFEIMSIPIGSPKMDVPKEIGGNYGLNIQEITPEMAGYLSLESGRGVMVSAVRPDSPAERDGVQPGDILVEIDGEPVRDIKSAENFLDSGKSRLKAKIVRHQQILPITLNLK